MVVGEGAGCLILEELEHARRRNVHIYAEVVARGSACCASRDGTGQWDRAIALAIEKTLRLAQASPEDVGHVNAHGVATRVGDVQEAKAILSALGTRGSKVPVLALKGFFGNTGAGCGALELIASVLALDRGVLPASLNFEKPDPECPLNMAAGQPQPIAGPSALNVNVTRLGQASCLLVRRYESA
jgi:3-oxoacyl-[acyl-carrier-protein] synthase II